MRYSRLPSIVGELFLAGDGFLGRRCELCAFVVTARALGAVDAGMTEHYGFSHTQHPATLSSDEAEA